MDPAEHAHQGAVAIDEMVLERGPHVQAGHCLLYNLRAHET